jgi:hypothetical protein
VIVLSNSDVVVGLREWSTGVGEEVLPLNLEGFFVAVKILLRTYP